MMTLFEEKLARVLTQKIAGCRALKSCERLSGGASQETYRLIIDSDDGERTLAMRRASGAVFRGAVGTGPGLAAEAELFRLARDAGVPGPEIHYVLQAGDDLGEGFIMSWIDGEALGAKIVRDDALAEIRPKLAFQCGEILARLQSIDIKSSPVGDSLQEMTPAEFVSNIWDTYKAFDTAQPMIDYVGCWLMQNLPQVGALSLVHNDFRNGNFIVSPTTGIVAVIDWEIAHIGDPMRDLGWLCTNSWRYGRSDLAVGGFGTREDLFAGHQSVTGRAVDPEHVKFWEVFGTFWWAVGCLTMADIYRQGSDTSVERPGIGRRSSEGQIDAVNLLIPGPIDRSAPASASATSLSTNMPGSDELLTSVRDLLRGDIMAETAGRTNFLARVGANSLDIVLRELEHGPANHARQHADLEALLGKTGDFEALQWELVHALRAAALPLDHPGLAAYLRQAAADQIAIDQPKYSGYATALAWG